MGTQPQVDRRSAADTRRAWPPRRLHAAVCEQAQYTTVPDEAQYTAVPDEAQYTAVRVEPLAELENPAVHVVDAA
jgi:hypothetical protein